MAQKKALFKMKQMDNGCPHMPVRDELSHPVQREENAAEDRLQATK